MTLGKTKKIMGEKIHEKTDNGSYSSPTGPRITGGWIRARGGNGYK